MQLLADIHHRGHYDVSILIQPEGRMQLLPPAWMLAACIVSILIQPEGRMQRPPVDGVGSIILVSILIQPEGRMQQGHRRHGYIGLCAFQSSSNPRAGCNDHRSGGFAAATVFQSSSNPRAGCNPWPAGVSRTPALFQSSSNPRAGCNLGRCPRENGQFVGFNPHPTRGPDATVRRGRQQDGQAGFNPHPTRGPDATADWRSNCSVSTLFQSSSNPRAGCNLAPGI